MASKASPELSRRERQILQGIVRDQTFREIAERLGLSYETVKTYADRLRGKVGVRSKYGLALWGARHFPAWVRGV